MVYYHFAQLLNHFKDDRAVLPLVKSRWNFLKQDVHGLSYIFTPRFAASELFIGNEKFIVMSAAKKFVLKRYPGDYVRANETQHQMTQYVAAVSRMKDAEKDLVDKMSARDFWDVFGKAKYPLLYDCAKSLNEMVSSSAASERAWSIFGFVHTPLRNRLSNEKVEKIVFLYINSAILDDKDKTDYFADNTLLHGDDFID